MISVYEDHAGCIGQVEAEAGDSCPTMLWNGQTFLVQPSGAKVASHNSPGGFALDSDLTITVLVAAFGQGPFPVSSQNLLYSAQGGSAAGGKKFRIESVMRMPGGNQLRLACVDAAQGLA